MTARLMTTDQVADVLGVDPRTVREIVRAGDLPKIVVGRRTVRFHPHDVDAYIRERRGWDYTDAKKAGSGGMSSATAGGATEARQARRKSAKPKASSSASVTALPWADALPGRSR